jgi:hypothetical protein
MKVVHYGKNNLQYLCLPHALIQMTKLGNPYGNIKQ